MSDRQQVISRNSELALRIHEEAGTDPKSPYRGKFVGIANGQVVAVADNAEEVIRQLDQIEADPWKTLFIEAGLDYGEPIEIWTVL